MRILKTLIEVDNLIDVGADQILELLKPKTLLERFAARKVNKVGATREFLDVKGLKG